MTGTDRNVIRLCEGIATRTVCRVQEDGIGSVYVVDVRRILER